jgi:V/A-type H+-transporting ATPase subunit I
MIAKMKKYSFLVYYKEYNNFLEKLRDIGVVHVIEKQKGYIPEEGELYNRLNEKKRIKDSLKRLSIFKDDNEIDNKDLSPINHAIDGMSVLNEIEDTCQKRDEILSKRNILKKELEKIEPWGDFDIKLFEKLENSGVYIHFHVVSQSKFDAKWIEQYNAVIINKNGASLYFVTITNNSAFPEIDTEHIKGFELSKSQLKSKILNVEKELEEINVEIIKFIKTKFNTLVYAENKINDNINWEKVLLNSEMHAENKVIVLEGYVPVEKEDEISKALNEEDLFYRVGEVTKGENPPILLKNNKFSKLFEVISNLYDRPSYHGFDLTAFYAPFYVIFFGLCVGDCGYGLLYLIISFFLSKSKNEFMKSISKLVLWLGIGTVIFGFISGTFFGVSLLAQTWPWFEKFKVVIMNSDQAFYFALVLGAIQLTYAMIINIVTTSMRFGFTKALDTLGWLITIWGIGATLFLSSKGIIPAEMKLTAITIVLIVGGALMLLFNNPEKGLKGIPVSIGSGLWGLYNKITGLLGDLLSYIRLFALGISGAVLGLVFNQLAFSFAPDIIILKQLVVILILLFGHSINIFLCSLSAFVHPMRLTFVEFYNNAGFEGGGKKYEPFKRNVEVKS